MKTKRRTLGEDHNQCPTCSLYFNSDAAFDKHRTGKHGVDRRCMTIPEMETAGMCLNSTDWWIGERGPEGRFQPAPSP